MTIDGGNEYKTIGLSQGTIRYREYGQGEPIVFIHGLLVNGSLWRKTVPLTAQSYRCIVPDLPLGSHEIPMNPGADLTPTGLAKIIAEFIAALNLDSVTLVGNDTGGALCQITATEYPERIARLALTNCDCFDIFPPQMFAPLKWAAWIPGLVFLIAQSMRFQFVRQSPSAYGWLTKRPIDDAVTDGWLRQVMTNPVIRRDLRKVLKGFSPRYTQEAAKKLGNFKHPVLLAWAPEDRFFPYEYAERLNKIIPNARLERIEDSRTFVPEDQPERLAELIADLMRVKKQEVSLA